MQEVDQLLEWLDQWAGFSPESRSVNHRRIVYGAWLLFLVSLLLPAVYSGPVLSADASTYPGLIVWLVSFVGFILAPAEVFQIISAWGSGSGQGSKNFSDLLLFSQWAIHAVGNFLLLSAPWARFKGRIFRSILYSCTLLAMSLVVNPFYNMGQDLCIGYYLWVAAHITLSISTWVK